MFNMNVYNGGKCEMLCEIFSFQVLVRAFSSQLSAANKTQFELKPGNTKG